MAFSLNSYPVVYRAKYSAQKWTDEWIEKPYKSPAEEAKLSEAERDALSASRNFYDDMPLVNYTSQYGLGCFEGHQGATPEGRWTCHFPPGPAMRPASKDRWKALLDARLPGRYFR
ncbi:hypothetical protein MASR2M78_07060 [Treponema sp.]